MIAIGPLFSEQNDLKQHRVFRDKIAPLEGALASYLREKGLAVVGNHPQKKDCDEKMFTSIKHAIDQALFV